MRRSLAFVIAFALALVLCSHAIAAEKKAPGEKKSSPAKKPAHVILNAGDIQWVDAPPSLPPGAKMAVLDGDPGKAGLFILRLKIPDGYKVAAHWHPNAENVTVLSGTFYLGTGDKLDESKGTAMSAGAFARMPGRMHHFAWTKGSTELQVSGMGPFAITYVNSADDPRKAKK